MSFAYQVAVELIKRKDKCSKDGNSQECEKPSTLSGAELGVAIGIPIVVVIVILGGLAFRAYKVNKREQKEFENDPEFYKNYDEFVSANEMPAYPPPAFNHHSMINNDSSEQLSTLTPAGAKSDSKFYPPSMYNNSIGGQSPNGSQLNVDRNSLNPFSAKEERYPPSSISHSGSFQQVSKS